MSVSHGPTLHREFPCAMLAQIDPDKIIDYYRQHFIGHFPAKRWLCALGEHCTSKFIVQCYLRQHWLHDIHLQCWEPFHQHCTGFLLMQCRQLKSAKKKSSMWFFNNVVNIKLTEHGRIYKIFHVTDIESLLEIDNLEEYINNASF